MSKVLYLSYDGMTDPLGQSQVVPYLLGLSRNGYRFTLISFEKEARYLVERDKIQKLLTSSKIQWIPLTYHKSPPVASTIFDLLRMRAKAKIMHQKESYDIVHCRSYLSALVGIYLKRKYRIKFVFDMRGFWADERVEGRLWNLNNPVYRLVYRFFKRQEKIFLEQGDYIVSLTERAKREILQWDYIERKSIPIRVIPCCADTELFNRENIEPDQVDLLRKAFHLNQDHFVLVYLGSLGTWYMLAEMLDFFQVLLQYKPQARFLLITKDDPEIISALASQRGIPKVNIIITFATRQQLPNFLALADLSVFFIKPVFSKKASSPTKQGELMGMGVPIVCNDGVGDTSEIILETQAGAVIAAFSEQEYHRICKSVDSLIRIDPQHIHQGAQNYYSLKKGIEAYSEIYADVLTSDKLKFEN